ncbi:MAG: amidase [Roseobacter sp.]
MTPADTVNAFVSTFALPGAAKGPLAGRTFGAKDLFDIDGHVTGYGNPDWARTHIPATATAPAVQALLDAGATLLGKTHTDELAYSLMGANAHYGTPVNSADPRRVPGGSSSGSAAAVAAGLVDFGLGSDTGGSVRIPASFCGVWGLRTTFGLIPLEGAMPFTASFDTVGWFARNAATMAAVADTFGCPEGPGPTRLLLPVDIWARADPACVAAMAPAMARLQAHLGPATPIVLAPDGLGHWRETFRICQAAEIWQALGDWITEHRPHFGPGIAERFQIAETIDAATWASARAAHETIRTRMIEVVTEDAVLVLPTAPAPAPLLTEAPDALDEFRQRAFELLCPAGLSGHPQLSVPVGVVEGGPVGMSLLGAPRQDRQLIALANAAGLHGA